MFQTIGKLTTKHAALVVAIWALFLALSFVFVPPWSSVAENGEFAFLASDSPSIVAEKNFREYFPEHSGSSNIVLVIRRETSDEGLSDRDREFIGVLQLRLCEMFTLDPRTGVPTSEAPSDSLVQRLYWYGSQHIGEFYDSLDGEASLIVLELNTEFLDQGNMALIDQIEEEIAGWRRVRAVELEMPVS